ncbi:MAG: TGS domain-containing protein [Candidatus Aenigmatarchaeota archaeon]|nr:MAG: TGS domain-containing protein [Candidatus Aenigmarchaeota archaeon]
MKLSDIKTREDFYKFADCWCQRTRNLRDYWLNEENPNVIIKKTERGGVKVSSAVRLTHINERMVKIVMKERGIHNAEVLIREDLTLDRLIDSTSRNRVYVRSIVIYNKVDLLPEKRRSSLASEFLQVSSLKGEGVEVLKRRIWGSLGLMRIYMKKTGKPPDMKRPLIIHKGSKVRDVAERIHKDFERNLEYARIWGPSAKFDGQKVGRERVLKDRDIVELHME